jgi:ankyrin repeat protein/mono/diheme cytochrome c family protein
MPGRLVSLLASASLAAAQVPAKVDFRRDVQPIFQEHCISCHGPSRQMNGFRLDRRSDAMRGGTIAVIGPGNSAASRLYLRLVGNRFGQQMPPAGPLTAEQIGIIKSWIDQGAVWPDEVSGEAPRAPADRNAARMTEALRHGDRRLFAKILRDDPGAVNRGGPGGSTPLMFAALYGDAAQVRELLERGADPNAANDAGATALMWAADDLERVRLLVERGADVNARSGDNRTPLLIAAGWRGSSAVVKLLLDRGANPSVWGARGFTPLAEAAWAGDEAVFEMLVRRGADLTGAGRQVLGLALLMNCARCAELLFERAGKPDLERAWFDLVPPRGGDAGALHTLLARGADPNARGPAGNTVLALAASSDSLPASTIQALIERGADVHARTASGASVLGLARLHQTAVVDVLLKAGARDAPGPPKPPLQTSPARSARVAFEVSMPLLQRADIAFLERSGCVSCHNNSLAAMTIGAARRNRLPVDEELVRRQLAIVDSYLGQWRERVLQGVPIPGDSDTIGYLLTGVAAENYPPNESTDALARYLKMRQSADGKWRAHDHRPPLTSSDIQVTVRAMRALQTYAPRTRRTEYARAVRRAAEWLASAQPRTTDDLAFQLVGLAWAGGNKEAMAAAARKLLAQQRSDGGWAQMPALASDAYATGEALVALHESGSVSAASGEYKRGVQFLLNTQREDGSWYVKTRSIPFMPYFESDFPHGVDQFISAAATNWAAMALAPAAR